MNIVFCTFNAEKLKIINNLLKIPIDFVNPEEIQSINFDRYFCVVTTEKLDNLCCSIPIINAKRLIRKSGITDGRYEETLDSVVSRLLKASTNLTENKDYNASPILNETIAEFEHFMKDVFIKYKQPFIKVHYLPFGYSWGVFISHDVDTLSVKEHGFDVVMLKSMASAYFEFLFGYRTLKSSFLYTLACVKCILFGSEDPLYNIEEWIQLEKKLPSTFYFALENGSGIKYSREQVKSCINLLQNDFEIGVHGQSYLMSDAIKNEFVNFTKIAGKKPSGMRMHYLRLDKKTWEFLENAEYVYDSTYGYSHMIGYKSGTVMPYIVPEISGTLVEIPLHVMDTTLFNIFYMNLSLEEGIFASEKAIKEVKKYNGILSVLIHQRSITKHFMRYRNWYMWLREKIISDPKCWVVSGDELARWHKEWYNLKVEYALLDNCVRISLNKKMERPLCVEVLVHGDSKKINVPPGDTEINVQY